MADIMKVKNLPPGWQIMGQFLELMANPVKYQERMTEFQAMHDSAALIVSKVGKAEEIDGLHAAAVEDRDESNVLLARAEKTAKEHTTAALEAKAALISKGSAERKTLMGECEAKCDALRSETQDRIDAANAAIEAANSELADRKAEVKRHEEAAVKVSAANTITSQRLEEGTRSLESRLANLDRALAGSKKAEAA